MVQRFRWYAQLVWIVLGGLEIRLAIVFSSAKQVVSITATLLFRCVGVLLPVDLKFVVFKVYFVQIYLMYESV